MHPEVSEKNTLKIERIDSEVIVILCRVSAYRCLRSINKSGLRHVRSEATKPPLSEVRSGGGRKKPAATAAGFFSAEAEALEPVLSQNITQSQMPINNQLITIIIKSKYYRISLAISIFGCIFGCRISNTPSHEHQTKHHFCT